MGWHYILKVKCTLLPEFIPFIQNEYLRNFVEYDPYYSSEYERDNILEKQRANVVVYESFPKSYKDLIDVWNKLHLSNRFYDYELTGNVFYCHLSKKVSWHDGDLRRDYETFLKDIIVPISSEIHICTIESDDNGDCIYDYTDAQLRGVHFHLPNKIKYVEHVYNEDKTEILETRVVYKHNIRKIQFLDLDRAYGLT
jgi:hypothetical protein